MTAPIGVETEVVVPQSDLHVADAKNRLRTLVRQQRARRSASDRARIDAARTAAVLAAVPATATSVACYLSTGDEPDTLRLVDELHRRGLEVLVPLLRGHRTPAFGSYRGREHLRSGLWGIPEPVDADPVPLARADLVLCSALAVTRDGRRLGVGGGWYDRALPTRRTGVPVWALVNADEVLADVPCTHHDQHVDAVASEAGVEPAGTGTTAVG